MKKQSTDFINWKNKTKEILLKAGARLLTIHYTVLDDIQSRNKCKTAQKLAVQKTSVMTALVSQFKRSVRGTGAQFTYWKEIAMHATTYKKKY